MIFVDVEENIESVKNSRIYKLLIDKGYFLEEYNKEIGFKNLPNYQSVFKLKKNSFRYEKKTNKHCGCTNS